MQIEGGVSMALTVKAMSSVDWVRYRTFFVWRVSLVPVPSREVRYRAFLIILIGLSFLLPANAPAQGQSAKVADRITGPVDSSREQKLPNHVPSWANRSNDVGPVPDATPLSTFTLVLERSPEQEQAFEQLLKDQQDSASAEYHHWLTPLEMGDRFGLSEHDVETIQGWLTSQGLHVNWVAPSRIFISFGGTAADIKRAFQTELHLYNVGGEKRMSVASAPKIPQALAPAIKAIHGLYTVTVRPAHHAISRELSSPDFTDGNGNHFILPGDFATIYDLPSNLNINLAAGQSTYDGTGVTIGIVGLANTDPADFDNFRALTGSTFANPATVYPTAYGGASPSPAETAQVSYPDDDQLEATLDVTRAGSIAPGAKLLLVVSSTPTTNGLDGVLAGDWGIQADIAYLVNTMPLPAQVMSISFGGCESVTEVQSTPMTHYSPRQRERAYRFLLRPATLALQVATRTMAWAPILLWPIAPTFSALQAMSLVWAGRSSTTRATHRSIGIPAIGPTTPLRSAISPKVAGTSRQPNLFLAG